MTDITSAGPSVAFVRGTLSDAKAPPKSIVGPWAWAREHLVGSVGDALLTAFGVFLIAWIAWQVIDFALLRAVWRADNGEICRAEGVGACWPYVAAYWKQFVYGRYPEPERWRATIVFLLFAATLIPLAIPSLPYKRLNAFAFLIALPIVAFFLLTGGNFGLVPVETTLWGGLLVTLIVSVTGIVCSLPLGILLALGRRSELPIIRIICIVTIEFWRGVPLITVLFMASNMLPLFMPAGMEVDKLLRALIGVAIFTSAYLAETIRGGLQAIPKGQYEGAMALGLGFWRMMGLIIMPQALKMVIPGIVNSFISLFKDTTLVLIVSIFDLLGMIQSSLADPVWISPVTGKTGYLVAAMTFWVFCFGMSRYSQWLERRLATGHKR